MTRYELWGEYKKYVPHKNCKYPADRWDYCWTWADYVDKNKKKDCINKICIDCEFYIKD